MTKKATLLLTISAGLLTLILGAVILASYIHSSQTEESKIKDDWIQTVLMELGSVKLIKTLNQKHFKKDIFIIKNKHSLADYKKLLEQYFNENNIPFRHKFRRKRSVDILSILYEDDRGFLRILELKKNKKGVLVKKTQENQRSHSPKADSPIKKSSYSDLHPSVISIVIDDAGIIDKYEDEFLNYPLPITYAVIPFEPYSRRFAEKAKALNKEVIIHAPMEGSDDVHHKKGIRSHWSENEIEKYLISALNEVPGAVGLNNHRGSKATENKEFLTHFFNAYTKAYKSKNLFFLDSKTSSHSLAYNMAVNYNIPALERAVFLDNSGKEEYITKQVFELIKLGRSEKGAIGIAHCTKGNSIKVLKKFLPYFKDHNVKVIPLSEVLKRKYYVSIRH